MPGGRLSAFQESAALSVLRECAGGLSDLVEGSVAGPYGPSTSGGVPGSGSVPEERGRWPETEAKSKGKGNEGAAAPKKDEGGGKKALASKKAKPSEEKPKRERKKKSRKKSEHSPSDGEESEAGDKEERDTEAGRKTRKPSRSREREDYSRKTDLRRREETTEREQPQDLGLPHSIANPTTSRQPGMLLHPDAELRKDRPHSIANPTTSRQPGMLLRPDAELRKDRPHSIANPTWRVYLDNFDLLEKVRATQMVDVEGSTSPAVWALRSEYEVWRVPRNLKKAVSRSSRCELEGATVDGVEGVAFPRESKLAKYLGLSYSLCQLAVASQKQWQVVCGGLVYFTMFRRGLLSGLNNVWQHIESYNTAPAKVKLTPEDSRLEVCRAIGLLPLARIDFRLDMHPMVTCSDASSGGGGFCASAGLTPLGEEVSKGGLRGESLEESCSGSVLSIGLFDGIGALRVALDALGVQVLGHVSVETQESAHRVVEAHFPGCIFVSDVRDIDETMVQGWSTTFSQCSLVLIGGGPPCQGVSGLNCDRRGALRDSRSSLFAHVPRVRDLCRRFFPWCQVHALMESVASMDPEDRMVMSDGFGEQPLSCNAGDILWCHRPRLYWMTWNIEEAEGYSFESKEGLQVLRLDGSLPLAECIRTGWLKVDPSQSFPTFTTSRPRSHPGRKPAGIRSCDTSELQRWELDSYRFPPYQYKVCHSLVNRSNILRLPDIEERETMMGFPPKFTAACAPKGQRSGDQYLDTRLSLIGNSWAVPVVACLLAQLFWSLCWIPQESVQSLLDRFRPLRDGLVQGRLVRLPLNPRRGVTMTSGSRLAFKLGNLISLKGEDILLTTPTSQMVKFHRLRASVPSRLWKWKIIAGWQWKFPGDHINALEMKALVTSLRWRIEKHLHNGCRIIHLTDSLVCLHALCRGRSSSRKLRRSIARLNALTLASNVQPVWAYVHTDQNPADKPSRWGRRVRSKYRDAPKTCA
eukprot:Skav201588  [mRNA]  locus=scaffold152:522075:528206:+ [translate_table: standard]